MNQNSKYRKEGFFKRGDDTIIIGIFKRDNLKPLNKVIYCNQDEGMAH